MRNKDTVSVAPTVLTPPDKVELQSVLNNFEQSIE